MIPLALFDKDLNNHEKDQLSKKIRSYPMKKFYCSRSGTGFGKPDFEKNIPPNDLVQAASSADVWKFFEILKIPIDFLKSPSNTWMDNPSYLDGLEKTYSLKVCNDAAERSIKMIQDFLSQSKDEDKLQDIVQVVEKNRSVRPNLRKRRE